MLEVNSKTAARISSVARIEFDSYLRDGLAVFWTCAYPILLFLLLWMIFAPSEDSGFKAQMEVSGTQSSASRFETRLDSVSEGISGVNVELTHVDADADLKSRVVRVVLGEDGNYELQSKGISGTRAWSSYLLAIATLECYNSNKQCAREKTTQSIGESTGASQSSYNRYLTIGIATLAIMSVALLSFSDVLIRMRAALQLRMIEILPMASWEFLVGFALSRLVILVAFSVFFIYTMNWLFGAGIATSPLHVLIAVLLIFFGGMAFLSVAFVIAAFIESTSVSSSVTNILNIFIMMLSDLFIPIALMPAWLQSVIHYTPVYMFVTAMREVLGSAELPPIGDLLQIFGSLILVAVVALGFASDRFRWSVDR